MLNNDLINKTKNNRYADQNIEKDGERGLSQDEMAAYLRETYDLDPDVADRMAAYALDQAGGSIESGAELASALGLETLKYTRFERLQDNASLFLPGSEDTAQVQFLVALVSLQDDIPEGTELSDPVTILQAFQKNFSEFADKSGGFIAKILPIDGAFNNEISTDRMIAIFEGMGYSTGEATTLVESMDTNNNGGISRSELENMITHLEKTVSDGVIGDFKQGTIGDCWVLAGILCMANTPEGRQLIDDSITDNGDGTYTVVFAGDPTGTEYIVTQGDLQNSNSSGDIDVAILEEAARQHYANQGRDIGHGGGDEFMTLLGGRPFTGDAIYMWGDSATPEEIKAWLISQAGEDDGLTLYLGTSGWNGFAFEEGSHALTIVDIDVENNTISYINPWDSSEIITQDLDEFAAEQADNRARIIDRDGEWSPHTRITNLAERMPPQTRDRILSNPETKDQIDLDGDGELSQDELYKAARNGNLSDSERAAAWSAYKANEGNIILDFDIDAILSHIDYNQIQA